MKNPKICPKCLSLNIERKILPYNALGAPSPFHCNNCGFESFIFPEIDPNKTKELNKIRNKSKISINKK